MDLAQAGEFANARSSGERLDFGNVAQNLELHHQIVSKPCASVNNLRGNRLIFWAIFFISLDFRAVSNFRNEPNSWPGQSARRLRGWQPLLACVKNEQRLSHLSPQRRLVSIDPLDRETAKIA